MSDASGGGSILVADRCIAVLALFRLGRQAEARALLAKTLANLPADVDRDAGDVSALLNEAIALTSP